MTAVPDPRATEARALVRRAVAQGCRPVWAGGRLTDLLGPKLAVMEFTEALRRLVPDGAPEAPGAPPTVAVRPSGVPLLVNPPDPEVALPALIAQARALGVAPVLDAAGHITALAGPPDAVQTIHEALRALFPPDAPDPATEVLRQGAKVQRQQIEAWRRGLKKRH